MPKTPRSRASVPADLSTATVGQLTRLPAEVLRLHLSSRHLVTTGNKSTMAQRLYQALHPSEQSLQSQQPRQHSSSDNTDPQGQQPPASTSHDATNQITPALQQAPVATSHLPPELQAQFSSLVNEFIRHATATTRPGNLSPASDESDVPVATSQAASLLPYHVASMAPVHSQPEVWSLLEYSEAISPLISLFLYTTRPVSALTRTHQVQLHSRPCVKSVPYMQDKSRPG